MRVILDTNVIVAAMRSTAGASHALLLAAHRREIKPVISVPLVMEYEEVCKRPGMIPCLAAGQIDAIVGDLTPAR